MRLATWIGKLFATGRPVYGVEDGASIYLLHATSLMGRILYKFRKGAITLGETILICDGNVEPRRIKHELAHVAQWRKYGYLFFILYPFSSDRFEAEAREAE